MSKETRSQEFEIIIDASPEQVFHTLTSADRIPRWFSPEASVTPGPGGSVTVSWGPGMEGTAPITTWAPGHRFAWTERAETEFPKIVDFTLESVEGGKTRVRLVQSGFGMDASFDAEFDSTSNGWNIYMQLLRVDLESHRDLPSRHVCQMDVLPGERPAVFPKLLSAIGFTRNGDAYTARLATGLEFSGSVVYDRNPGYLALTLDAPFAGAVAIFAEATGPKTWLTTSWYLKGDTVQSGDVIAEAWKATLAPLTSAPSN